MSKRLKFCPFCGGMHPCMESRLHDRESDMFFAQVRCGHCCATGSSYVDETMKAAKKAARKSWNEVKR